MILVGDTAADAPLPQQIAPGASPPMRGGNGLFKKPMGRAATATAPFSPPPAVPMTAPGEPSTVAPMMAPDEPPPQQGQPVLSQAQQMVTAQNYTEALALVDQVLQMQPQDGPALVLKAQILGTVGRFPEALLVVDQLTQFNPNNALAWSMRAVLLSNMQQFQDALITVDRSLALDPGNPETNAIKSNIMTAMATAQNQGMGPDTTGQSAARETKGGAGGLLNLVISSHTPTNARLLALLNVHPSLVVPVVVLGAWLIAAITAPPLLAIIGLVSGIVVRQRKQRG